MNPSSVALDAFAQAVAGAQTVLFMTGAGISADSGLPTYRGVGGLYDGKTTSEGVPIEVALSGPMLRSRPELTWKYLLEIDRACRGATPNLAHEVLVRLEQRMTVHIFTQNVDGLHTQAGSSSVIEIHGRRGRLRCTACAWSNDALDYASLESQPLPPRCPVCSAHARPDVVLFEEMLPEAALRRFSEVWDQGVDLVVSVGTSGLFSYIRGPVVEAHYMKIPTVEINPARTELADLVDIHVPLRAAEAFGGLWARLESSHN